MAVRDLHAMRPAVMASVMAAMASAVAQMGAEGAGKPCVEVDVAFLKNSYFWHYKAQQLSPP